MDGHKIFKQSFQMEKEQLERLGGALRKAREAKGVKLREVAKVAGVSSQAVGQWERGENGPSMGKLIAVGKFLDIDVHAAMGGAIVAQPNTAKPSAQEVVMGPDVERGDDNGLRIPVLGISMGGREEDEKNRSPDFWMNGETVNYVRRPPGLANAKNVFSVYVRGDSMWPRFDEGALVFLQKAAPAIGDDVVIEMHPRAEGEDSPTFIKHLVRRRGSYLTVRQFNPDKEIDFDLKEIKNLFRVIPTKEWVG